VFQWIADRRHRRFRDDLSAYLDGRLSERRQRRLEEHLAACPACERELNELRSVVEAVKSLPTVPAPRSFAIQPAAAPRVAPAPRASLAFGALSAAALVVFGVLLGSDLLTRTGGGTVERQAASGAMAPAAAELGEGAEADEGGGQLEGAVGAPEEEAPAPTVAAPAEVPEPYASPPAGQENRGAELAPTPAIAERAPAAEEEGEEGSGRTVLRALEAGFAGLFLAALGGAVWIKRRGDVR